MTFIWPKMLWLLALVPLLALAYLYVLNKRKQAMVRYSNLAMVKAALGGSAQLRRHVPPLLLLGAILGMFLAIARPATTISLPSTHETVILAIDISGSMRADDVKPNRLAAAQAAARAFVEDAPRATRIGVVAFAGDAALVQAPTRNRDEAVAAINGLQLQHATAVGSGLLVSLKALFPERQFDPDPQTRQPALDAVAPGSYGAGAIILLTDGQTTSGPDPVEVARLAAERGVRVFTVGVGTPDGQVLTGEGWSIRVRLDEDALRAVADLTRGDYYFAGNASDLKQVYATLTSRLVLERKETEVTAIVSALATALVILSATLSLLWYSRPV